LQINMIMVPFLLKSVSEELSSSFIVLISLKLGALVPRLTIFEGVLAIVLTNLIYNFIV